MSKKKNCPKGTRLEWQHFYLSSAGTATEPVALKALHQELERNTKSRFINSVDNSDEELMGWSYKAISGCAGATQSKMY